MIHQQTLSMEWSSNQQVEDETVQYKALILTAVVSGLVFASASHGQVPASALMVDENANVGVGTEVPVSKLHVQGPADTRLLVENTDSSDNSAQIMFQLKNGGPGKIRFSITNNGTNTWTFDNNYFNDWFSISKVGTLVDEFVLKSNGDGVFRGNSYATNHVNTSSRSVKTDFTEIDGEEILNRLSRLSVSKWRYLNEDEAQRHIGPVAEDFKEAFDLCDGVTISTVDANGIALAAIKGLKRESDAKFADLVRQKDAQIAALQAEIASQHERLAELEMMLAELLQKQSTEAQVSIAH